MSVAPNPTPAPKVTFVNQAIAFVKANPVISIAAAVLVALIVISIVA